MLKLLTPDEVRVHFDEIAALFAYCRLAGSGENVTDELRKTKINDLIAYLEEDRAYLFSWLENGVIVGFLWACELSREGERVLHIAYFAVLPSEQGKGIGRTLLTAAEEKARELGIGRTELKVNQSNTHAIDFYSKNKYKETGTTMTKELS